MLEIKLAQKFIEQITQYTDYNINIMNDQGVIIASRDPKRVGTFHEVAYHIVTSEEDLVMTQDDHDYPGVRTGINQVIKIDGVREGVVGVTGNPEEIRSVALITKMAFETMLKYEKQQQALHARQTRKERFMTLLTHDEFSDPDSLRRMASELNYSEDIIRIAILCRMPHENCHAFMEQLKRSGYHHPQDIRLVIDPVHILIFKALPEKPQQLFSDYKYHILNAIKTTLVSMDVPPTDYHFYIGSFQKSFSQYYNAYTHCLWLEKMPGSQKRLFFFYDYINRYMQELIPMNELQKMFNVYEKNLDPSFLNSFKELIGTLIECNYNFVTASKQLFVHKNTLVYRYNKIKDVFNINPVDSSQDRAFLEAFYTYLIKDH